MPTIARPTTRTSSKQLRDAGAIILAKANMGEYAAGGITGSRSSFGGHGLQPLRYRARPRSVERRDRRVGVAANLVTCAIGEESGTSVREPAKEQWRRRARAYA